ncbi:DUF6305 family protein [Thermincola potens]|uniref:DUF6305 domain-containing protein n=1 Tax=Thermincola potens (strain JR) TaxID=635013 RepID=D5XCN7_THEPJ|nr:DUF6305 family protein [Thermincola potens]ADG81663.1 hypothetical protein TherJR_0796 [Thermincola potens JR]
MAKRFVIYLLAVLILVTAVMSFQQSRRVKSLLPHLPAPIAREKALVTPAGQGPEGLIAGKICDVLNISNDFMYWAEPGDLEGHNTLILALGFSKQGLYSMHKTEEEEMERVKTLVMAANKKDIPVILLHLGGQDRRGAANDSLARMIAPYLDYIIVTQDGEGDKFFTGLATKYQKPITVVSGVKTANVPLNSAFR